MEVGEVEEMTPLVVFGIRESEGDDGSSCAGGFGVRGADSPVDS